MRHIDSDMFIKGRCKSSEGECRRPQIGQEVAVVVNSMDGVNAIGFVAAMVSLAYRTGGRIVSLNVEGARTTNPRVTALDFSVGMHPYGPGAYLHSWPYRLELGKAGKA